MFFSLLAVSELIDMAPCFACPFSPFSHSQSPSMPSICLDQSVDFANSFPSPFETLANHLKLFGMIKK